VSEAFAIRRQNGAGSSLTVMAAVVAAGVVVGGTDQQLALALALVGIGAGLGLLFINLLSAKEDVRFLCTIFLLGIAARCIIALVTHYVLPHGTFALDDGRYNEVGLQLAAHWRNEGSYPAYIAHTNQVGWFYVNGAIYWLFGFVPLVPAFLNCLIGSLSALFIFYLCRESFDRRSAIVASLLAMFFPSIMLWASINLKDALTAFCIVMILWSTLRLQRKFSLLSLLLLLSFITLLGTLRSYLFVLTSVSVVTSLMIGRFSLSPKGLALGLLLMLAFVGVYQRYGFGSEMVEAEGLKTLSNLRSSMAEGNSAYAVDVDVETPLKALTYLPKGLAYFLLAPAPWQIFNLRQALTFPEMLLWYALLPMVWRGIRYALSVRFRPTVVLLSLGVMVTLAYALVESNLGTAYRHRAQVLMIYLIFAGLGLVHRRRVAAEGAASVPGGPLQTARAGADSARLGAGVP
jgi:hypothetical protein